MDRYELVSDMTEIFSLEVPKRLKHLANSAVELINNLMKNYKLEPVFNVTVFKAMFESRMNVFRTDFNIEAIPHADRVIITWYKQTSSIKKVNKTREDICKDILSKGN